MPSYVAFLRAINLGPTRKFPKDDIRRCVEATGATGVQTHINTGNVLLTTPTRSREKLERSLEEVFAADRGFAVPTIAYRLPELTAIGAEAARLAAAAESPTFRHYVTLLKDEPSPDTAAGLTALSTEGEQAHIAGRAVHVLLTEGGYGQARLSNARIERALGIATTRDAKVIAALVRRWCGSR